MKPLTNVLMNVRDILQAEFCMLTWIPIFVLWRVPVLLILMPTMIPTLVLQLVLMARITTPTFVFTIVLLIGSWTTQHKNVFNL